MLDVDAGNNAKAYLMVMMKGHLLILLQIFQWSDCTVRVFWSFSTWIIHSHILQKYIATTTIFIPFSIKLKCYFQWSLIQVELMQHETRYTVHPVGTTPSLCALMYVSTKKACWCYCLVISYIASLHLLYLLFLQVIFAMITYSCSKC